jgi:hypothetical protein
MTIKKILPDRVRRSTRYYRRNSSRANSQIAVHSGPKAAIYFLLSAPIYKVNAIGGISTGFAKDYYMKCTNFGQIGRIWRNATMIAALACVTAWASEKTAFDLAKEADKHVGEDAKGKVVQIRSEKSIGSLTPTIWYVVLYDTDATAKATEVKFGAGQKLSVKRPARVLELGFRDHLPLDKDKLKVDSDEAIKTASTDPLVKNLKLTASKLNLEKWEGQPVWKVRLWAEKLRDSRRDADIGEVIIAADTGKVLKNDLKIERVD